MSRRQFDTSTPAMAETMLAHQTEALDAELTPPAFGTPLAYAAPGAGGVPSPQAQAAALIQASGGQLARAGHSLLQLQRLYGNRYVQRVVSQSPLTDHRRPVTQAQPIGRSVRAADGRGQPTQAPQRLHGDASGAIHQDTTTGLPDPIRSGLETLSGLDLSGVRVYYNSPKPVQVQASAYPQGQDIHVGPG